MKKCIILVLFCLSGCEFIEPDPGECEGGTIVLEVFQKRIDEGRLGWNEVVVCPKEEK